MGIFKEKMSKLTAADITEAQSNLIPEGDYNVQCDAMELRTNEYSGKQSLSMKFKILGPKQTGRVMFNNIYCFSDNEKHNKRQLQKLGTFAASAGIAKEEVNKMDLEDFIGLKAGARIKIQKSEGYDDKNEVSHYKKYIEDIKVSQNKADTDDVPF